MTSIPPGLDTRGLSYKTSSDPPLSFPLSLPMYDLGRCIRAVQVKPQHVQNIASYYNLMPYFITYHKHMRQGKLTHQYICYEDLYLSQLTPMTAYPSKAKWRG